MISFIGDITGKSLIDLLPIAQKLFFAFLIQLDEKKKIEPEDETKVSKQNVEEKTVNTDSVTMKRAKPVIWSMMKDVCVSLSLFIIVILIANDLNPKGGGIFVWPLKGSSENNPTQAPEAATLSGDSATTTRRYRNSEDKPFFNDESSFVDDYYEGHIFSAFQVLIFVQILYHITF